MAYEKKAALLGASILVTPSRDEDVFCGQAGWTATLVFRSLRACLALRPTWVLSVASWAHYEDVYIVIEYVLDMCSPSMDFRFGNLAKKKKAQLSDNLRFQVTWFSLTRAENCHCYSNLSIIEPMHAQNWSTHLTTSWLLWWLICGPLFRELLCTS